MGLADFTVKRLVDKIDMEAFYQNVITSGFPERGKIPLTLETDQQAVELAFRLMGGVKPEEAKVVRIWDTLHLSYMQVSESLLPVVRGRQGFDILPGSEELSFTSDGSLKPIDWKAWIH